MKLQPSQCKFCVYHTTMHHVTSCKATYVKCMHVLAVTCHPHFWQNDRDLLCATVVTQGWNGYWNKSQHRKSTLEKKILLPHLQWFKPTTFQSRIQSYNHWAIPAPLLINVCFCDMVIKVNYHFNLCNNELVCIQKHACLCLHLFLPSVFNYSVNSSLLRQQYIQPVLLVTGVNIIWLFK